MVNVLGILVSHAFLRVSTAPYILWKPHITREESPLTSGVQSEAKLKRNVQKSANKSKGIKNVIILLKVIM